MPQAIPAIAATVGAKLGAMAAAKIGASVLASAVLKFVGATVVAYATSRILGLDEPPKLSPPGTDFNVTGSVQPVPIIYGRRLVAASFAQVVTSGTKTVARPGSGSGPPGPGGPELEILYRRTNDFLNLIAVWSEGEIDSVESMQFDRLNATNNVFSGFAGWTHHLGADDQVADADFLAELAALANAGYDPADFWTSDHRLRGVAYSWIRLKYSAEKWPTGMPLVTAYVRGRKVLDLRTSTWGWSDNPALCLYDYLTNARFGRGIDTADIDTESFIEAANYCDQEIFFPTQADNVGTMLPRYRCNALLNPDDSVLDNVRALLGSCRGSLVYSGGLYKLVIDRPTVPSFALTENNILGDWSIDLESADTRYNQVVVQFPNRFRRYDPDLRYITSPTYRTNDGGQLLEARVETPCVTDYRHASAIAGMAMRQSRYSVALSLRATIEALQVEVGDVVTVTHRVPGWVGKEFRVMATELLPDGEVKLQLAEYAEEVYDLTVSYEDDSESDTTLPDPRSVEAPADLDLATGQALALVLADGTVQARVRATWEAVDAFPSRHEVRWRQQTETKWTSGQVEGDVTEYIIPALQAGVNYTVEVRTINSLGVPSAWTSGTVLVKGRETAPDPVSGLTGAFNPDTYAVDLAWTLPAVKDIAAVKVWLFYNTDIYVIATLPPVSSYSHPVPRGPIATYLVQLVSTEGIESSFQNVVVSGIAPRPTLTWVNDPEVRSQSRWDIANSGGTALWQESGGPESKPAIRLNAGGVGGGFVNCQRRVGPVEYDRQIVAPGDTDIKAYCLAKFAVANPAMRVNIEIFDANGVRILQTTSPDFTVTGLAVDTWHLLGPVSDTIPSPAVDPAVYPRPWRIRFGVRVSNQANQIVHVAGLEVDRV